MGVLSAALYSNGVQLLLMVTDVDTLGCSTTGIGCGFVLFSGSCAACDPGCHEYHVGTQSSARSGLKSSYAQNIRGFF